VISLPIDRVRALKERLYKDQVDGTAFFRRLISARLSSEARVLDVGCGSGHEPIDFRSEAALVVGCDLSQEIRKNRFVSRGIQADACRFPFQNGSFDLVFMDFFLEHLQAPQQCAHETFRVLKPNGCLVFRTPNLYHYVAMIANVTPHWFHRLIAHRARGLHGSTDVDVCRTYYRANTSRAVGRVFSRAGFVVEQILMVEREPSYLMFARPAFLFGYWYERLVNRYESLAPFRSNIFGIMRKPCR
jgi:SAM-dependent methyltransferase